MSKPAIKLKETLHTCPLCSQSGFSTAGLKTHQGNKTCKARALTLSKKDAAHLKEFDTARRHVASILEHGRRTVHESILLGHELTRLKLELGRKQGGDHTSTKASLQTANLLPWDELVEQQTGLSYATCNRCMQLSVAAKKHIPVLTSKDVLQTPFNALPEVRQAEVVKALEKAADGRSMSQLMVDFGAWKEKKKNIPPPPNKQSAAKRAANANDATLQAEQLMQLSEEHIDYIENITGAEAFKALPTDRLAHFENILTALQTVIGEELKTRRKSK